MRAKRTVHWTRLLAVLAVLAAALLGVPSALADAAVPQSLLDAATADPLAGFDVIVDGAGPGASAFQSTSDVLAAIPVPDSSIGYRFHVINGVSAHLSGGQVLSLALDGRVSEILPDSTMSPSSAAGGGGFSNPQLWTKASEVSKRWGTSD